jgi:hypothetical protein
MRRARSLNASIGEHLSNTLSFDFTLPHLAFTKHVYSDGWLGHRPVLSVDLISVRVDSRMFLSPTE